jgi:hypothetical protein
MERKMLWYTSIRCISFPRESRARYTQPSCIGKESREVVDDKTNHRGAWMAFHMMNPIDTWKKPCKISRITIHQRSGGSQRIWCEYRHSTRRRKNAKASGDRSIGIIWCLSTRELWFPDREVDVIIHTDLLVAGDCKGDERVGSREFIEE